MLPPDELARVASVRGHRVIAVRLCAMRGCGEEFEHPPNSGLFCLTWGVVLEFDPGPLAISWQEDTIGDPFRIGLVDPAGFLGIESLVQQDVSALPPWSRYVGCSLDSYELLTYESNYGKPPTSTAWRSVPWGLLLNLGSHRLLAAAAHHWNPLMGSPCADELVLAFSDSSIREISEAREGERSEWSMG